MHQFPTGFSINAEKPTTKDVLTVELPTKNGTITFTKTNQNKFDIHLVDNSLQTRHLLGKSNEVYICKRILEYLFTPHKECSLKTIKKDVKKIIPKKRKKFNLPLTPTL